MYLEKTNYFAQPEVISEVLELRREACAIRTSLGLARGLIFLKDGTEDDGPDVSWECSYASKRAYEDDLALRASSPEFEAVRERMSNAVDSFERHLNKMDSNSELTTGDVSLEGFPVVPKRVVFESHDLQLTGFLYLPPGDGPFPCVITNHGSAIERGTTDLCRPGTASLLMSWGYASFLPHRSGYGDSPGVPWETEVSADFATDLYDHQLSKRFEAESDDVVAAAQYLSTLDEIHSDRIAVMGSSFGGTVSLWASAKSDRFCCAVDFAGAAINWDHTSGLRDAMTTATRNIRCPIYFLQAANDYSIAPTEVLGEVSSKQGHAISATVFPAFGLTNDEGHYFERYGSHLWGPAVRAFLAKWV